jgi:hypothetical protein
LGQPVLDEAGKNGRMMKYPLENNLSYALLADVWKYSDTGFSVFAIVMLHFLPWKY